MFGSQMSLAYLGGCGPSKEKLMASTGTEGPKTLAGVSVLELKKE